MKFLLSCLLLSAAVISLDAAPAQRSGVVQLYKAGTLMNVQDIWTDCSSSSDPAKILNLTITPDPPTKGATLKMVATVNLTEQVTAGQIVISLKYGFIPIPEQKIDLCDSLKESGQSCPLSIGVQTMSISESIPGAAPSGHYKGNAYVRDQNGKELVCIALDFHM